MRQFSALVAMVAMVACSRGPNVTVLARDELPPELYGESVVPKTEERSVQTSLYFVRTDAEGNDLIQPAQLKRIEYEERTSLSEVQLVARRMLQFPRDLLAVTDAAGIGTAIPEGTELLSVSVKSGLANLNLSAQFENAAPDLYQVLRVAQVVYTLTELTEVNAVRFSIHGATQPVVDQDGMAHEQVTRAQYSRFAPVASELGEEGESQVRAD